VTFQEVGSYDEANVIWWQLPSSYIIGFSGMHDVPDGTYNPMYGYFANDIPSFQGGNMYAGGYGFMIVCHEFGHMLGLAHPHDGGGEGDATTFPGVTPDATRDVGDHALNQGIWTTMSYNAGWNQIRSGTRAFGWQSGPMAFDIAALQILYGANMTYNTGNDTYVLPSGTQTFTAWSCIWDAGGIDTISAANLAGNCVFNLNDAPLTGANAGGYVSWMLGIPGGFTIANKAEIENAIGGNGNDRITGNELSNELSGGLGKDTLDGGAGADNLNGGGGNDLYLMDDIGDQVAESDGSKAGGIDLVQSSASIKLGDNIENVILVGTGDANMTGNGLANILMGNSGNNILDGGAGADQMSGGKGNDLYFQDNANDKVSEAGGDCIDELRKNQTLAGALSGIEHYSFLGAAAVDFLADGTANRVSGTKASDKIDGAGGDDSLTGNGGNDTLTGGAGADSLNGGAGADSLIGAELLVATLASPADPISVGADIIVGS
jgi:serralysin